MISESVFTNLGNLRMSAKNNLTFAAASSIVETGEKVLLVCIGVSEGETINVYPHGVIPGTDLVTDDGRITDKGRTAYDRFFKFLKDKKGLAFFRERDDRVELVPSKIGKAASRESDPIFTFAWGNPYEIFSDPTATIKSEE